MSEASLEQVSAFILPVLIDILKITTEEGLQGSAALQACQHTLPKHTTYTYEHGVWWLGQANPEHYTF